jgi:cobalt/nickel transport system permease protein
VHIPDGYLGPQTYIALDAAIVPVWAYAAVKVRKTLKAKQVPLMALGAAFAFVIMMFNVPVLGGTTAHAVGAVLIAVLLGPWAAVLSISTALVIQALAFGDGGITAIGANCMNMAVIMPFVGYAVYRVVAGSAPKVGRKVVASGVGAYVGLVAAAIVTGVEFGIQPLIAHDAFGRALYAPYPLKVAVPAMALSHLLVGFLEAAVTMGVVAALARSDPALVGMRPSSKPLVWVWALLGVLILLTPLGLLAPGSAWGEWDPSRLAALLHLTRAPAGLARLSGAYRALMPGYGPAFIRNPAVGYVFAAVAGAVIIAAATWLLGRVLSGRDTVPAGADDMDQPASKHVPALERPASDLRSPRRAHRSLARRTADAVGGAVRDMLHNEELATGPGLMQRLDPRVKLGTILLLAVTASFVSSVWVLVALFVVTMAAAAASNVSAGAFARRVWASAGLFAILLAAPATTSWITPGRPLLALGPLVLTAPGVLVASRLVARVAAGAGIGLLVVWTTRWSDLMRALTAMHVPAMFVATFAMTQQQIVSLMRTVENMHLALESRTLSEGSASENREWVIGRMAFIARKSLKTADDVYDAMLARGYSGAWPSLSRLQVKARDWAWIAGCVAVSATALGIDRLVAR